MTAALRWSEYIAHLADEHGSLAAVALKLASADGVDASAASVERALRRLRTKSHEDGGQYGRWLLRTFGMPREVELRAKWMGVYHSRFTDLPVSLCLDQLHLWDRPPLAESRTRAWLELGFATCALRQDDLAGAATRLAKARGGHGSTAARLEALLLEAYLASRRRDRARAIAILDETEPHLESADLEPDERACLLARWLDQRAYQLLHPRAEADLTGAKRLYARTPEAPLFAAYKRESGLAYVALRGGDKAAATAHAERACRHAGDGGFVRMRVAALGLLAHVLGEEEGKQVRERAVRAARALEDEDLVARVSRARGNARAG
jgi:hypothetical protein